MTSDFIISSKMSCPGNGIYVVQGEMAILLSAMRRGARWSSHTNQVEEQDALIRSFTDLKDILNQIGDLRELDPNQFLGPFLDVIRSEETTGPVTSLALSSVNKFIAYGLIDSTRKWVPVSVENIADAVTHARFVGTDQASDGVVLMKILQVLRTLMLSPEGTLLSNESVCEIMLSCFKLSFETRLTELLRRSAEHCLKDMIQHLFSRLPQFHEDLKIPVNIKKLKMRTGSMDSAKGKRKQKMFHRYKSSSKTEGISLHLHTEKQDHSLNEEGTQSPAEVSVVAPSSFPSGGNILDMQGAVHQGALDEVVKHSGTTQMECTELHAPEMNHIFTANKDRQNSCIIDVTGLEDGMDNDSCHSTSATVNDYNSEGGSNKELEGCERGLLFSGNSVCNVETFKSEGVMESNAVSDADDCKSLNNSSSNTPSVCLDEEDEGIKLKSIQKDYVNPKGVRFTCQELQQAGTDTSSGYQETQPLIPYGVVCIRELFRFLISLCNPLDKQNTEMMIHMGLTLLLVAFEIGADSIGKFNSLLSLVRDELCRNLFALLNSERLAIFAPDLQVLFLVFESLRTHLKFQLELYLTRLIDIIVSDSPKVTYEHKEIALESIVQLWRIPGLVTELYLNYDCDLYCPNLFEDITKLLSKNAFPVSGLYNTHLLSLDALLTVIDSIERHCHIRALNEQKGEKQARELSPSDSGSDGVSSQIISHPQYSRQRISENIPSHEELLAIKHKKKLLATGTEHFNTKPKKGIQFLQEHNLLSTPLDPQEVVNFLRENPRLDKKMIGEYISNRSNLQVLNYFVKSFDFADTRIDEALRLYLETFRLPGESPLISLIMEHFAEHWHKCNGEPFVNADAAFTLAYAVIMLNVDQHNHNVKRQNNPMTVEDFKRNLKKVNGGEDFDQDMLDDIYNSIRHDEIVMPAEQTGLVKENYLWKVLLRRGASKDGTFIHAPNGLFDYDLFALIWGPTVAALSFVFDKSNDANIYQKAISGFRKCAMISAHFGMSNDFDNLVISLCKFTTLLNSSEPSDILTISFGSNPKAQLAAKTVFSLAHRHGDILREGWKNVLDCMLQLYRCKILPEMLVEAEDFIHPNGKISLMREETPSQKAETGLFSSLYSYIALASETSSQRIPSPEDQEHIQRAQACVKECHLEHLITESKFLRLDSLQELVKALVFASHSPESHISSGMVYDEDATVFFLELLLKVIIQNRDRVHTLWQSVRDHIYSLVMGAAACDHNFLLERSVVGLLRLAIHLMRREDMSPVVLQSLRMLLLLKSATLFRVARQVAYGLFELLKTSAANIHSDSDWAIIFTLLECIGAGAPPPKVVSDTNGSSNPAKKPDVEATQEENESALTTDSEIKPVSTHNSSLSFHSPELSPSSCGGWILVGCKGDIQPLQFHQLQINQFSMLNENDLLPHDPYALIKCCESLAFLVRDVAHITPYNFENCVHCIRTFVEASLSGRGSHRMRKSSAAHKETKHPKKLTGSSARRKDEPCKEHSPQQSSTYDASESDSEELPDLYPIQLLDLMHTLHTRTAQIFQWWAEEGGGTDVNSLWVQGWCPLLQGIARLCCDSRRQVRTSAITYLQRALLVHDLQTLTAVEWESCFRNVLFPLLMKLLEPICPQDPAAMEETRMRAATVLSKVFLHHLTPLLSLPSFKDLWLTILDFMDKYMHVNKSDLLYEAIPESLKNMLLVMDSAGVFSTPDGYSELWHATWERIGTFLPKLKEELFKSHPSGPELREKEDINIYTAETSTRIPQQTSINIPRVSEYDTIQLEPSLLATETVISSAVKSNSASVILQLPAHTLSTAPIFTHMGQQNAFCAGAET